MDGSVWLFVLFDFALDLDLEVGGFAGGDILGVFDLEVEVEIGVLIIGEGGGLGELLVVETQAFDQ